MSRLQRETNNFKKSILIKWIYSYLTVCLIPMVLFVLFAATSLSLMNRNVSESNTLAAEFMRHEFDLVFNQINLICDKLVLDSRFRLLDSLSSSDEIDAMSIYGMTLELSQLLDTRTAIANCMLYSPSLDFYFTARRWGDIEDFSLMNDFDLNWSKEKTRQILLNRSMTLEIEDATTSLAGGSQLRRIIVLRPLNFAHTSWQRDFYVAFLVDISEIFTGSLKNLNDLVIMNELTERVVYDFTDTFRTGDQIPQFTKLVSRQSKLSGQKMLTAASSDYTNLKYVVIRDQKDYYRSLINLLTSSLLYFFLALIAGIFVVWRLTNREWTDYERAMADSGTFIDKSRSVDSAYSPFLFSLSKLKQEKEGMNRIMNSQKESLKSHIIAKLLDYRDGSVSINTLSEFGIHFSSDKFIVLLLVSRVEGYDICDEEGIIHFFQQRSYEVLPFSSPHGIALILNPQPITDEERFYTEFSDQVEQIRKDITGCFAKACSSDLVSGLDKLGEAYLEAVSVLERCKYSSVNDCLFYHEMIERSQEMHFSYTAEEELALIEAIQAGDAGKSLDIIGEVIQYNSSLGVSPQRMRYLLFNIASTAIRTANRLNDRYENAIPDFSLPPILLADDFEHSRAKIEEQIHNLCNAVYSINSLSRNNPTSETYELYRKALAYIDGNFHDSMLNVTQIADHLKVTIVSLSRVFKKHHGLKISDYISHLRIVSAKKALAEGALVTEVVSQCGFGSLRTLMRVFKNEEKITPGQYRTMHFVEVK